jgi:hypothetical protein
MDKNFCPCIDFVMSQKEKKQISKIDGLSNGVSTMEMNKTGEGNKEGGIVGF